MTETNNDDPVLTLARAPIYLYVAIIVVIGANLALMPLLTDATATVYGAICLVAIAVLYMICLRRRRAGHDMTFSRRYFFVSTKPIVEFVVAPIAIGAIAAIIRILIFAGTTATFCGVIGSAGFGVLYLGRDSLAAEWLRSTASSSRLTQRALGEGLWKYR